MRAGVDINVAMIGFGKTNRQIFLTSVANNQFITEREGRTELKKVHYHIFDKNPAENNKNLNHSYYRYKQEREGYDADAYLPLPSLPADESYHKLDVNDTRFYNVLHDAFTSEKNSVNFAVIAFGSDLENIDFAQKLLDKRAEWGVKNLIVFVKTRKDHKDLASLTPPDATPSATSASVFSTFARSWATASTAWRACATRCMTWSISSPAER